MLITDSYNKLSMIELIQGVPPSQCMRKFCVREASTKKNCLSTTFCLNFLSLGLFNFNVIDTSWTRFNTMPYKSSEKSLQFPSTYVPFMTIILFVYYSSFQVDKASVEFAESNNFWSYFGFSYTPLNHA
jgi:hypothetical protein